MKLERQTRDRLRVKTLCETEEVESSYSNHNNIDTITICLDDPEQDFFFTLYIPRTEVEEILAFANSQKKEWGHKLSHKRLINGEQQCLPTGLK